MKEAKQPEIKVDLERKHLWEEVELVKDKTKNLIVKLMKVKEEKKKVVKRLNEELDKIIQMVTRVLEE